MISPHSRHGNCPPITTLALAIITVTLTFAASAQAQGLDRLDAHNPPDLLQGSQTDGGFLGWLQENKTLFLVSFGLFGVVLILYWIVNQNQKTKRLQRDALEKLRKSLLESCKATRSGAAKHVWTSGSDGDPPTRLGRYAGHHRSVDAVWIAYRPWLFATRSLLCVNPVDVNGVDVPDVQISAIGVNITRGFGYAVPNVMNPKRRAKWQASLHRDLPTPEAFSQAWKAYYAHAVDNAIAFYDAMNAAEDRSFLRQEVTRSPDELTETLIAPTKPTPAPEEATTDA